MNKIIIIITTLFIFACNSSENKENEKQVFNNNVVTENEASEAYKLMEQKCIICHVAKPSPEMKGKMLAPPMMRIKEHYLPSFPNKEDFVNAIVEFSKNPTEDKVLMPGATRKFNLMPNFNYTEDDLKNIAEIIYSTDFGTMQRIKKMGNLELNNGNRWKLKPEAIEQINEITKEISTFSSDNIKDYNKLGHDLFNKAKILILDKDYDDQTLMQIKIFFHGVENDMHNLIGSQSVNKAQSIILSLETKFKNFFKYFE